ncbi:unnamed protein product, partial [Ectocarpus sp. 4 AP-2014]
MAHWGVTFTKPQIDVDKVRARKDEIIATLSGGLGKLADARKVKKIHARGVFVDSQTLNLEPVEGADKATLGDERLTFDHCILATGSVPAMPKFLDIGSPRVVSSTGALALPDIPESLLVVGGGYIGLEMGTVYAELGSKVTVIELGDGLLPGADRDLVRPLAKRVKARFEKVLLKHKVSGLKDVGDKVEVSVEGPEITETLTFDRVLISIGRWPVSKGFGLENTKVVVDDRGFVE